MRDKISDFVVPAKHTLAKTLFRRTLVRNNLRNAVITSFVVLIVQVATAQTFTGLPSFSSVQSDSFDTVKITDGSILLTLPVRSKSGLVQFNHELTLNNVVGVCCSLAMLNPSWVGDASGRL